MTPMKLHPFCLSPVPSWMGHRKCGTCIKCVSIYRADWVQRCLYESLSNNRTWFCTFTFRRAAAGGDVLDGYRQFQLFFKRLRKSGLSVRYICCNERGDLHGRYHLHALLYGDASLTRRQIQRHWTSGFSHFRLLRDDSAKHVSEYVAKYVNKGGRIRASANFGKRRTITENIIKERNDLVVQVFEYFPDAFIARVGPYRTPYMVRKMALKAATSHAPIRRGVGAGSSELLCDPGEQPAFGGFDLPTILARLREEEAELLEGEFGTSQLED